MMRYRTIWLILLFLIAWCGKTESEPNILEKLRTRYQDVGYQIAMMGEDAAPFLVGVLTDKSEKARGSANYLLEQYYADPNILPALTYLFLDSPDTSIRSNAIHLIASVDAEYAKRLIGDYLDDPNIQDIVVSVLTNLRDKRVIPLLVERLKDSKERIQAAFALADFKDKRAVPILLEILEDTESGSYRQGYTVEKLAYIGDVQTLPVILNLLDKQSNLSYRIRPALSQSEPSLITELLKTVVEPNFAYSSSTRRTILDIIGNQKNPELIPYYERVYLDTDDSQLKDAVATALGNMGEKGFESLLKLVRQKPNTMAIEFLSSYNSADAIDAITSLALDESFPLRMDAIRAFLRYRSIWNAEVSKHIPKSINDVSPKQKLVIIETLPQLGNSWNGTILKHLTQLLATSEPDVRILTIDLIRRMNLAVMAPALKELMRAANGNTSDAAHMVYDLLQENPQLELNVELDQERYDYEQSITITYRITNVSDHPIYIALYKSLFSGYVRATIQKPDGTIAKYRGPIASLIGLTYNDINTLQPGDEITGKIPISKYYDLSQPGVYAIQLQIKPGLRGVISKGWYPVSESSRLTWSNTLVSPKELFQINSITDAKLNDMIESIDPDVITEENRAEIIKTCYQLAEIGKPEGIAALKKLALMNTESSNDFRHYIKRSVQHFLIKNCTDPQLVSTWMDTFNIGFNINTGIEMLRVSGDARAIKPLRRITFRLNNTNDSVNAALALQQLGDESGVKWLRKIAFRKLQHWKKDERNSGAVILVLLESPDRHIYYPLVSLRNPRFYARNYGQAINWSTIQEKAATPDGLKELLHHDNPIIQRSTAYELAYLGDKTGIDLIQQDLHAKESVTRLHARNTLSKLKK